MKNFQKSLQLKFNLRPITSEGIIICKVWSSSATQKSVYAENLKISFKHFLLPRGFKKKQVNITIGKFSENVYNFFF